MRGFLLFRGYYSELGYIFRLYGNHIGLLLWGFGILKDTISSTVHFVLFYFCRRMIERRIVVVQPNGSYGKPDSDE